ncbi:MAG: hypothetical protein KJ970_13450 [Candidatus Eisenbacteria bacterium]|uniref:ThuA domain-containing protein n=1 Tax=Eiseniibacteriota bacterium TaxID=2212470 RepID=A0A948RW24_UNCEI|nr:hypothetical protein [Candidatus Eisenbacteria bacterium]MBU1949873.1 hypothetical protein [Candidatus Eisenbacteria bacterium]MBU2691920.1 hypothetical protein [Candidatus Eisenbacteria bacterium]
MRHLVLGFLCILVLTGVAVAEPDHTGYDPDVWVNFEDNHANRECTVYFYNDPLNEVIRFTGLGYSVTVGSNLSFANISSYDVVVIPLVGPGFIASYQADLEAYVGGGGGLYIHQPGAATGALDYAPTGFGLYITAVGFCMPWDANAIVEPGHPTMDGLNAVDLPGRFDTIYTTNLGAGYTLIAQGTGTCATDVHCAGGLYSNGKVFLDTSNLSANSADPGSNQYVINVVEWLCGGGQPTPAESSTWGTIKSTYR